MIKTSYNVDFLIIGSGVAGLLTALELADYGSVLIVSKQAFGESNTRYAQGGIAAAWNRLDSADSHFKDTLKAGCYHNVESHVQLLTDKGQDAIQTLLDYGVSFDRDESDFMLAQEGAHSQPRVLHFQDKTGIAIMEPLLRRVQQHQFIQCLEFTAVVELVMQEQRCVGAYAVTGLQESVTISSKVTCLATGGAGQLFEHTSNPKIATGDGVMLAYNAGASLKDLEFVQFHPTSVLIDKTKPEYMLLSEALRGDGATLVYADGVSIMGNKLLNLSSRDKVSRAIYTVMKAGKQVYLDLRPLGKRFFSAYPMLATILAQKGLDVTTQLIPVFPTAHYMMGGVETDMNAATSVEGLYAIGEVACSGVHGANRLASNSLLEAVVFSLQASRHIVNAKRYQQKSTQVVPKRIQYVNRLDHEQHIIKQVQHIMWSHCGITRSMSMLRTALTQLQELKAPLLTGPDIFNETEQFIQLAIRVCQAAYNRKESLGAHWIDSERI